MISSVVFAGSPEAAVVVLDFLVSSGISVCRVVTQADARRGRGTTLTPTPVKARALDLGIPVFHEVDDLACADAQAAVVVAYGRLIPTRILEVMPMINVHFSLLPRWRGAAPVERAILEGDSTTGVCIMKMEQALDTGGVYASRTTDVAHDDTAATLTSRLATLGAEALIEVLSHWPVEATAQSGDTSYAKKITPDDLRIDWSSSATRIDRQVRAVAAFTTTSDGRRLRILSAAVSSAASSSTVPTHRQSGQYLGGNEISTGDGILTVHRVQPEGKGAMTFADWLRGHRVAVGDVFGVVDAQNSHGSIG